MKMKWLFAIAVFTLLCLSCGKEGSTEPLDIPSAENVKAVEDELLGIVNTHRNSLGLSSLEFSAVAYDHANSHTDYMIVQGGLSHDNFSSRASSITSKTNAQVVAENVAKDYINAAAAFQGWLESNEHKTTMEGNFSHTAVSVKKDSEGTYFYTQLFYLKPSL